MCWDKNQFSKSKLIDYYFRSFVQYVHTCDIYDTQFPFFVYSWFPYSHEQYALQNDNYSTKLSFLANLKPTNFAVSCYVSRFLAIVTERTFSSSLIMFSIFFSIFSSLSVFSAIVVFSKRLYSVSSNSLLLRTLSSEVTRP